MTFLKWIIGVPFVIGMIAFAAANGDVVSFVWSPLHMPLEWPLYALVLAAVSAGFIIGSLMTWAAGHALRRDRRTLAKENKKLHGDIDKLQDAQVQRETLRTAEKNLYERLDA